MYKRQGYAIEYDYFDPTQLKHSLESKIIKGLFFAGQVNGTTGHEEAGGQGTVAGINAALHCVGDKTFEMNRDESYIDVYKRQENNTSSSKWHFSHLELFH